MKSIHSLRTSLCAAALLGIFAAGCETDPNSSTGAPEIRPMAAGGSADAHPAITYTAGVTSKGSTYNAVHVCDSDGTDQTAIYTASATSTILRSPTWSPSGGTIAFQAEEGSNDKIYTRDVSVSRGKASGSNTQSIYSATGITLRGISWSSVSTTGKIAFITQDNSSGVCSVYSISASGGTPALLYQSNSGETHTYGSPTWNADDSRIAFTDRDGGGADTLRVINASTGALLESVGLGSASVFVQCEWSRSGMNVVAFSMDNVLYYVTPTSGSTPWTNNVGRGGHPTWSPNNSSVVTYLGNQTLNKTVYSTTTTSTIASGAFSFPEWKQ